MAIEVKTIDEETAEITDEFDQFIAPYTVHRANTNKLYLILRSIAAGFAKIRDLIVGSKYRFNPKYCEADDLESAMLITGEQSIPAKATICRVVMYNTSEEDTVVIPDGVYVYRSPDGTRFTFQIDRAFPLRPGDFGVLLFASERTGAFPVAGEEEALVTLQSGAPLPSELTFRSLENSGSLGHDAESVDEIRRRLLTDTKRQDSLVELQTAVRALPSLFAADLIFNPSIDEYKVLEDGTQLPPKMLAIFITGAPTTELAELVCAKTVYNTLMFSSSDVVYYHNPIFVNGKHPVYYAYHANREFYILIHYKFDPDKLKQADAESMLSALFNKYKSMVTHIDEISEPMLYRDSDSHGIPGVVIKKIYIQDIVAGQPETVELITIPRLSIPRLAGVSFVAERETAV